jgi:hypothetical protein
LVDPKQVEYYRFFNNGIVTATAGMKDGPLVAPVLYWKIDNNNLFISEDPNFETTEVLPAPYISGDVITVQRGAFRWSQFRVGL